MKIAFIGSGSMTQALASKWTTGHELFISGRDAAKAAAVADPLGAQSGTAAEAAAFGEVIVLATRAEDVFTAIADAGGPAAFAGKVVVDINNPVSIETFVTTRTDGRSLTEAIQSELPDARVGKAFNMAQASVWSDPDMTFDGRTMVTLFTADDDETTAVLSKLIEDVGSEPLHLGSSAHAYQLEAAAAMVIKFLLTGHDAHTIFNFIQPEVRTPR